MPRWGLLLHLYSQFHITNYFVSYICGFGQIKLASILSLKYLKWWWCMDSHWHGFDSHHHQWIYFIVINLTCLYLHYMILIQLIINLIILLLDVLPFSESILFVLTVRCKIWTMLSLSVIVVCLVVVSIHENIWIDFYHLEDFFLVLSKTDVVDWQWWIGIMS